MKCSSSLARMRRSIPFFPLIPILPLSVILGEAVAIAVLFRRLRALAERG